MKEADEKAQKEMQVIYGNLVFKTGDTVDYWIKEEMFNK